MQTSMPQNAPQLRTEFQSINNSFRTIKVYSTQWRRSVVVSALASINVVNRHWVRLVLGWVTVCEQVNHLGM